MRRERILLENAARPRLAAGGLEIDATTLSRLTDGDERPMFVTLQIGQINAQSRNGRTYPRAVYEEIVRQINANRPGGIAGHLRDDQRGTAHPPMVWRWLSAQIDSQGHVMGKAYVLPTATAVREEIRTAVATGARIGTSLYGLGTISSSGEVEPDRYTLEGIDLVHPNRVGIPATATHAILTAEMTQGDVSVNNQQPSPIAMCELMWGNEVAVEGIAETGVHERALQECEFLWGGVAAEVQQDRAPVGIVDEMQNAGTRPERDAAAALATVIW